jgi:alpha-tubulin suppressor-like RCC1 family protein
MTVTGVLTATTLDGNIIGAAVSIAQGKNLNVGVITASGIGGDITGSATSITQGNNVTFGSLTASRLVGDLTGNAVGNALGDALSATVTGITTTNNINVGVITATSFRGDGSNLDGVSSNPVKQQAVTADGATTAIDLSSGNLIYMTQSASTTVSFANTANGNVYIVRTKDDNTTARTITWPTGIGWSGGSAPTLLDNPRSSDAQVFLLVTRNMGETWYGKEVMRSDPQTTETWVWGYGGVGSLGLNATTQYSSPIQLSGNNWNTSGSHNSGGSNANALVSKTDGTLWSWGANNDGQLGLNNNTQRSSPVQIPGIESTWTFTTKQYNASAGGELWVWGNNQQGVLGQNGAYNIGNYKISSPVQIPGTTWRSIQGWVDNNRSQIVATKTDGTLWSWGGNLDGQLGQGNRTHYSSPTQVGTDTTWSEEGHTQYTGTHQLKTDGTMWVWGSNSYGSLGLNQPTPTEVSSPIQLPGTWSKVTGDDNGGVVAIKADGTAWGWGINEMGMLGLNQAHDDRLSSPTQIGTDTTWSDIRSGTSAGVLATKTDGTAWGWGYNNNGGLGLNDRTYRSSPTQIPGTDWINPRWIRATISASLQKRV